jgi:hypothetical protein
MLAAEQLDFLTREFDLEISERFVAQLKLGPEPQAFRRIRKDGAGYSIAVKDWRARFTAEGRTITVLDFQTGHKPQTLATDSDPSLDAHRAFVTRFARG